MRLSICLLWAVAAFSAVAVAQEPFVHGLWVWKTASLLTAPNRGHRLAPSIRDPGRGAAIERECR